MPFNWICPHCNVPQVVTDVKHDVSHLSCRLENQAEGKLILRAETTGCANVSCLKTTIRVTIGEGYYRDGYKFRSDKTPIFEQLLRPQGMAKPQPDYIPLPLREDYYEACLIRDLSPKASATLIRRCLQGMIRDFAQIARPTLAQEIAALRDAVEDGSADRAISSESVDAIDQVRGVGNIGAHMEKDIDLIIEVDPGEAQALIELVEMLFEEWYGARDKRQTRLAHIAAIADVKKRAKEGVRRASSETGAQVIPLTDDPAAAPPRLDQSFDPTSASNALLGALGMGSAVKKTGDA